MQDNLSSNSLIMRLPKRPIILFVFSLLLALAGTVLFSALFVQMPGNELQQLVYIMVGAGISTTIISYGLYRLGILQWLYSLRWTLLLIVLFTVALILINMWVLVQLMLMESHYLPTTLTMLVFAGLTAMSFGFFVSKTMTDRLIKLNEAAEKVAEGDLSTRLDVSGNDEIAQLTRSFNTMAHNLQAVDEEKRKLEKTRRDLVAWVSHDLRTPLTSMRVMLEALADGIITDEETQTRYMRSSLAEIEHLSHLIDDLFEMAQLDVGHLQLDYQYASISDLVSDTLGGMMPKARQRNITLTGKVDNNIDLVYIAPDKIQRVLSNLVQNAITYTPNGETVSIVVKQKEGRVQVEVHNTGVHIPENQLDLLFQSFYRGEKSRKSNEGERGTGLGLAIARGFVQAHGGNIWATSSKENGTTFTFTLPEQHTHA